MTARPTSCTGQEVRAILYGPKTQMRRVAKFVALDGANLSFSGLFPGHYCTDRPDTGSVLYARGRGGVWQQRTEPLRCPYGQPGDTLWVRETWTTEDSEGAERVIYRADIPQTSMAEEAAVRRLAGFRSWRSSTTMPRWASRLTLEVVSVRVERLQAITEADARAEGLESSVDDGVTYWGPVGKGHFDPRVAYRSLWESLHGPGSWAANPWVWVVGFRRCDAWGREEDGVPEWEPVGPSYDAARAALKGGTP